ncbi:MAG TPA: acetylglutamate kinase [Candidatus Binataceae bacterium]|nr:acetylglutamate kinase [Candidatus Binataceae bacterium]
MKNLIERADTLIEALPYIRRFRGKTMVIKLGGHAMQSEELRAAFAEDVVLLDLVGMNPVVVHGGGPQITELIGRLGLKSRFVRGMRVTDAATMEAAEMVLQRINKDIVSLISRHGGRAVGLSGKDGDLIVSRKMRMVVKDAEGKRNRVDIGLVGDVAQVNPDVIRTLEAANFIPVIAPTGVGRDGLTYNINADVAAGKIAAALKAEKLILLSDVEGVQDRDGRLIPTIDAADVRRLIARGTIQDGMIPKVECCVDALQGGVAKTHILDGRVRHAVLLEVFTRSGVGTEVVQRRAKVADLKRAAEQQPGPRPAAR